MDASTDDDASNRRDTINMGMPAIAVISATAGALGTAGVSALE
jgi:hypothetical protein